MTTSDLVLKARQDGRTLLTEVESKEFLKDSGINIVETRAAHSANEAIATSRELGFPVALKILSPDIVHKSDVGGVKLNLGSASAVKRAYNEIMSSVKAREPAARIQGVSVQSMAKPGIEVIFGMTRDPHFGPVLMFGLGGILVEVLKDVSFRIVPLAPIDAHQMIKEIKGYPILEGVRGSKPASIAAIEQALLKLSSFVERHPDIKELDLNPVFAYPDGLAAADARVVIQDA